MPLSRLWSSCGIPGIVYMAFRKHFNAISQSLLKMGPTALDAHRGSFVASLVPLERARKALACSSARGIRSAICVENLARACKISQRVSRTSRLTVRGGRTQDPHHSCQLLPGGGNSREVALCLPSE